jgi:glycine/D-amino acid oxidase-like deaminating enzyme
VAPDLVFSLIERHAIECEAIRAGTLHCAHSAAGFRDLQDRFRQQRERGAPVELLGAQTTCSRTGSTHFHGALFDCRAGTIQPLAYCRGLAKAAQTAGAVLHEASVAKEIVRVGSDWVVRTASGKVRAQSLLLATNGYHKSVAGVAAPAYVPVDYFQMATRPFGNALPATILPGREGCWDTATVMSSFRLDAEGRLIIGGVGALNHPGAGTHKAWAARKIATIFPALKNQPLEYAWFGRIAMTGDHLPKILRLGENAYSIFGYSGRGIGPGTVFGKAAAEGLLGKNEEPLPLTPIPSYSERFAGIKQIYYEFGATVIHGMTNRSA